METWTKIANGTKNSKLVVQFYNDHAIEKTISDLKVTRSSKIALTDYVKVDNDQSTDQVMQILGNPTTILKQTLMALPQPFTSTHRG
jgi:hypothetical protein